MGGHLGCLTAWMHCGESCVRFNFSYTWVLPFPLQTAIYVCTSTSSPLNMHTYLQGISSFKVYSFCYSERTST